MTRGRIINALFFLVVLGVALGVYLFYFKDKLEVYSADQVFQEKLEAQVTTLSEKFQNCKPDTVIKAWVNQTQPFMDAIKTRTKYFGKAGWSDHETYPKDGRIIKYWYSEESEKVIREFYQKTVPSTMAGNAVMSGRFPMPGPLSQMLNVANIDQWTGMNVKEETVHQELAKLSYGLSACELMMKAKPLAIYEIAVGEEQTKRATQKLLKFRSIGYTTIMTMNTLVDFIESLRMAPIYYSVDALSIKYANIASPQEPPMMVQILITRATYNEAKLGPGVKDSGIDGAADLFQRSIGRRSASAPGGFRGTGGGTAQAPPSAMKKAWVWFNRVFLARNV